VERGHPLGTKLKLGFLRLAMGRRVPDVLRVLLYRPEFFGDAYRALVHRAMTAPARWSRGERELFAAFTSRLNQCLF
jgi:hypothetical protein